MAMSKRFSHQLTMPSTCRLRTRSYPSLTYLSLFLTTGLRLKFTKSTCLSLKVTKFWIQTQRNHSRVILRFKRFKKSIGLVETMKLLIRHQRKRSLAMLSRWKIATSISWSGLNSARVSKERCGISKALRSLRKISLGQRSLKCEMMVKSSSSMP